MNLPFVERIYGRYRGKWTPYRTLIKLTPRTRWGQLRLHIFHRGDGDPDPHDHPSDFWTFPLTSYIEEVAEFPSGTGNVCEICDENGEGCRYCSLTSEPNSCRLTKRLVKAFRWHYRPALYTHRLLGRADGKPVPTSYGYDVPHPWKIDAGWNAGSGPIVTLVWWKPPHRPWGFWVGKEWVPWRAYVYGGNAR